MSNYEDGSLGWWIDERRAELRLTWDELATRANLSTETLFAAARGRPMRTTNRSALERALEWTNGDINRIRAGQEPRVRDVAEPARDGDREAELQQLREMAETLEKQAHELRERLNQLSHPSEKRRAQ
ncbi:hypothetical protein [Prauserella cavernicola]|uniref:XRE family transcriptional regulator n=1 Tax=Prauserella cavernicola TaxID=2800127 RepID=A0A934QRZ9_9PSEU|nr:hypothetical protein [Prauserella cavernicola]MBK1785103.1 hypothetical protein [Prauserella cavernicola]